MYSSVEVAPEVTSGRAPPPDGLEIKEISLTQSFVKIGAPARSGGPSTFALTLEAEGNPRAHILFASNAADQQRWFKCIRATSLGASIANVFNMSKDLGSGAFSVVKLAEDKITGEKVTGITRVCFMNRISVQSRWPSSALTARSLRRRTSRC